MVTRSLVLSAIPCQTLDLLTLEASLGSPYTMWQMASHLNFTTCRVSTHRVVLQWPPRPIAPASPLEDLILFSKCLINMYYKLGGRRVYVTNITVTKFQLISDIYDEAFRHHIWQIKLICLMAKNITLVTMINNTSSYFCLQQNVRVTWSLVVVCT